MDRDFNRTRRHRAKLCAAASCSLLCLVNAITSTTIKPLRRGARVYVGSIFPSTLRSVFVSRRGGRHRGDDEFQSIATCHSHIRSCSTHLPNKACAPDVCTCRNRRRKREREKGRKRGGIDRSVYSTFKRKDGR